MHDQIFKVSDLNRLTREILEGTFPNIQVEGEISNFAMPASGHWYFSLKDDKAQIRCAMFKDHNTRVKDLPTNGDQVMVGAKVSLYEGRGDYQLIVNSLENVGDGALRRAFEALKNKLFKAGLFDEARKQPLPDIINTIGVITSSSGAALHDILTTLKRRSPMTNVIIYPCTVQGDAASLEIINAIQTANIRQECDALVLARGGGSLEDLWCFNDEALAYAIHDSTLPIITGVGHEIDFTIADFVADHRAPTPTAAAEWVSKDKAQWHETIRGLNVRLIHSIQIILQTLKSNLEYISERLKQQHPSQRLQQQAQQLDFLSQRLHQLMQSKLDHCKLNLAAYAGKLNALSPLQTLARGYSITLKDEKPITDVYKVKKGDKIRTKLTNGEIVSIVTV